MALKQVLNSWEYRSRSKAEGKPHRVIFWSDGSLSCDCKGWTFKRSGQERSCSHVTDVLLNKLSLPQLILRRKMEQDPPVEVILKSCQEEKTAETEFPRPRRKISLED